MTTVSMEPVHILSLGAGVQSSVLALMAAAGLVKPMPVAAIFADTQAEPASVYSWLEWLEGQLPFPVYRVGNGDLGRQALTMRMTADGRRYSKSDIPVYTRNHDGSLGKIRQRSCTRDFKIYPIMKKARQLGKVPWGCKEVRVIQWIGISLDEVYRMKPSRHAWARSRWPLIELEMRRHDCIRWMEDRGYPTPPRSACVFCPYHSNHEWRRLRDEEPKEFARAVEFERELQRRKAESDTFKTVPFLHRSLRTLDRVDLSTDLERGQGDLFNNECEGICGV